MMKIRRRIHLPYLWLVFPPLILFSPLLFGGKALFWGTPALQFVPWWKLAWDAVLAGHLPLWNPLSGMGAPLLANYQSALLYPPTWMYFGFYAWGGLRAMAWAQALMVCLHLVWASVGMVALARRLGLGALAQTVSGLAFGLSGYLVARAWFASINATVAWLPWVLLFTLQVARRGARGDVIRLILTIAMLLLAGHAQTAWYTLLLAGTWAFYWGWHAAEGAGNWRSARASCLRFGGAALMGALLAAAQLLPTAEYLIQSARATAVEYDFAMTYSFWPWRLLGLLSPHLFGSPASGDYWGYGNYWEDAVYIGLLPFLLAVGVLIRRRAAACRRAPSVRDPLALFLGWLILVSFLLALGRNTPLFPWLYRHVPTFAMLQAPTRWTLWAEFALALLAGLGTERWRRPEGRALYWMRLATAGALAVALGAGLTLLALGEVRLTLVRGVALAGFWGLGAGALALSAPPRGASQTRGWSLAVVLWVTGDLLFAGWGLNPGVGLEFYTASPPNLAQVEASLGAGRLYFPRSEEDELKYARFLRFDTFDPGLEWMQLRAAFLPNLNLLDGLASVNQFDPLTPGRYARWMDALDAAGEASRERLLDLMGVGLVEHLYGVDDGAEVVFLPRDDPARWWWVGCARIALRAQDAWEQVVAGRWRARELVVLEGERSLVVPDCSAGEGQVRLIAETPNSLTLEAVAGQDGWLVVADTWYPGWIAEVDGRAVDLYRANYLFRAIPLPAGMHIVRLAYRPLSFYVGLGLSLLAAVSVGLAGIFGFDRAFGYNKCDETTT